MRSLPLILCVQPRPKLLSGIRFLNKLQMGQGTPGRGCPQPGEPQNSNRMGRMSRLSTASVSSTLGLNQLLLAKPRSWDSVLQRDPGGRTARLSSPSAHGHRLHPCWWYPRDVTVPCTPRSGRVQCYVLLIVMAGSHSLALIHNSIAVLSFPCSKHKESRASVAEGHWEILNLCSLSEAP